MFSVTSLGSGSKGNATVVRYDDELVLIDSGFSCKALEARLKARQIEPQDICAILVTHEHSDHFNGVPAFSRKYKTPVWMSCGTGMHPRVEKISHLHYLNTHTSFQLGKFEITPVAVPHDSREACQFILQAADWRVGILTDLGHITPYVSEQFSDLDILLLEFNHDLDLLLQGAYPEKLKRRVAGPLGHLSNRQACDFLAQQSWGKLKYLAAMHLSEENNRRELVERGIKAVGLPSDISTIIADQEKGFDWIELQ
ncbi:MBL fold metallo-hydrolase [Aliikangiella coralliicola]|uniref:MBL fold metallo-hydrolase n=1 Tax=Aliikangiella coralliicola TaxID=2592383 RepID=A0A545U0G4_9GAMM|nr:MBL fold metallo-hydrolase [Aliikangiella coralliicola]TQV82958.1 MBL fold metallo-hydrolase [Aliikangiella coralliicola]